MRLRWLVPLMLGLSACGPTEREVGVAVVAAMPAIVVVGCLLQLLYRFGWTRAEGCELPAFSAKPTALLVGLSVGAALILARDLDDEALVAFGLVGTSYATFLLVAMRVAIRSRSYSMATLVPWLLFAPVAMVLAVVGSTNTEAGFSLVFFILPGYGGLVSGPIAVLMGIEIGVRYLRRRRREREAEPVFPEAKIHND